MNFDLIKRIADAVLYEGYILYPYRASAVKNQHRFNFGVLAPRGLSKEHGGEEACTMRTECLLEGDAPVVDVRVRFLHLASRDVYEAVTTEGGSGEDFQLAPALEVGGDVYHTWQEAVEREVVVDNVVVQDLVIELHRVEFTFEANETSETLTEPDGDIRGRLTRRQAAVRGVVTIKAEQKPDGLHAVSVEIKNTTPSGTASTSRVDAQNASLISTHTLLGALDGRFVSLLDPPEAFAEAAAACQNVGSWPVMVGDEAARDMMLSSPIILYDYPQIAPESDGDFFDGLEIDEMLALRVMTLTDDEKREMQHVDDRARRILERTESMPDEHWQKLHGAIRGMNPVSQQAEQRTEPK